MSYRGPLRSVNDLKERNELAGEYWFSASSTRFFSSRVSGKVYTVPTGAYFVTSEQDRTPYNSTYHPRAYTVRFMGLSGHVATVGEFQQYASSGAAHRAARKLADRANGRTVSSVSAPYVCETALGAAQHAIKGGVWDYLTDNRTVCGRAARGVIHLQSGSLLPITCASCRTILGGIDEYAIEITTRVVSYRTAEPCSYASDPDHTCESDCSWMDGDSRELESPYTATHTPDKWDFEWNGGSVFDWALSVIRETSVTECSGRPIGKELSDHVWLSGSYDDPYQGDNRVTETSVYLTGDWTPQERSQIFRAATTF